MQIECDCHGFYSQCGTVIDLIDKRYLVVMFYWKVYESITEHSKVSVGTVMKKCTLSAIAMNYCATGTSFNKLNNTLLNWT